MPSRIPSGLHNNQSQAQIGPTECQVVAGKSKRRAPQAGLRGTRGRSFSLAEKLAARTVKEPDGCWIMQGAANNPAGHVAINHGGKLYKAHRVAWELVHGPIPKGLRLLHACDRPRCVNVDHLSLGTQAENIADSVAKGRFAAWHKTGVRLNGETAKPFQRVEALAQRRHQQHQRPEHFGNAEAV